MFAIVAAPSWRAARFAPARRRAAGADVRDDDGSRRGPATPRAPRTGDHDRRHGRVRGASRPVGAARAPESADRHPRRLRRLRILRSRRATAPATSRTTVTCCFPPVRGQFGWVFLGDILAPAVNSRGEVADLGDAPGVDRYDSVNSRGAPGFIVNEVNLQLRSALTPTALLIGEHQLHPAHRQQLRLGDVFDVDIAQVEWLPTESQRTSLFVGKIDSVIGIEYRERKADRRFGITPTLIARYTTGTALGREVPDQVRDQRLAGARRRADQRIVHLGDVPLLRRDRQQPPARPPAGGSRSGCRSRWRSASRAATVRRTAPPTPSTRCGSSARISCGTSGASSSRRSGSKGRAAGEPAEGVYGLRLCTAAATLELDTMVTPSFGVPRSAASTATRSSGSAPSAPTSPRCGAPSGGLRFVLTPRTVLKAEYLHNGEYGGIPNIPDDVFTTSLVAGF